MSKSVKAEYMAAHGLTVRRVRYTNWLGESVDGEVLMRGDETTVTVKDLNHPDHLYHFTPVADLTFEEEV